MRILLVQHSCYIGGAGLCAIESLKALQSAGHEIKVICAGYVPDMAELFASQGYDCEAMPGTIGAIANFSGFSAVYSRTFFRHLINIPKTDKAVSACIERFRPDVVIVNSMVMAWLGPRLKAKGIKSVCFVRETPVKNFVTRIMEWQLEHFDAVAFISEVDRDFMRLRKPACRVIPDPIRFDEGIQRVTKEEACRRFGLDAHKVNILFMGGLSPLKGYQVAVDAFRRLDDGTYKLIVAGYCDGSKVAKENIVYPGVVKEMGVLYRACDVVILPSTKPHQLMPVFEAGVMRVPVIISDFPQTKLEVLHEVTGFEVEPNNPAALAEAIVRVVFDPELKERLVENNYERSYSRHSFTAFSANMIDMIDSL